MKLTSLSVERFGRFAESKHVEFDPALTVFTGANSSGKSTLVRAIYFALTGKVLGPGLKPSELTSSGHRGGLVSLTADCDGKLLRLTRPTLGALEVAQQASDGSWQPCPAQPEALPALNPLQWRAGCFLHENELGEFIVQMPSSRRDLMHQLLGADKLLQAQELFILARRKAKRVEKQVTGHRDSLKLAGLVGRSGELAEAEVELRRLEARWQAASEARSGTTVEARVRDTWEQAKAAAQRRLQQLQEQLAQVRSGFAGLEEVEALLEQVDGHLAKREAAAQEVEAAIERRTVLSDQLRQTREVRLRLKELSAKEYCPTCHQVLLPSHVQQILPEYITREATLAQELEAAQAQEASARRAQELIEQAAGRRAELARRLQRWQELDAAIAAASAELAMWEEKLAAHPKGTDESLAGLQQQVEAQRQHCQTLHGQQQVFTQRQQEIARAHEQAVTAITNRRLSEWAADAVARTVQHVIGVSIQQVEKELAACLRAFRLFAKQQHSFNLHEKHLLPDIDGRAWQALSGSEKALIYLSMKVALSRLLAGAGFLVLDNPTTHLDEARRSRLRDYLLSLLPTRQIILFTNDQAFASLFPKARSIQL